MIRTFGVSKKRFYVFRRNERSPSYSIRGAQHGISIDDSDPDPASEPTHSQSESR